MHKVPEHNSTGWSTASLIDPPIDTPIDTLVTHLDFFPFGQAPLWEEPLYDEQALFPSPVLINTYARLIIHYLLDSFREGTLDKNKPLPIIALEASPGCFSILLLQALTSQWAAYELEHTDYQYLICERHPQHCQQMAEHPYLAPYLAARKAKIIQHDNDKPLGKQLHPYLSEVNPPIVLANHTFSQLPQELIYIHYGDIYQAEVAQQAKETAPAQPDSDALPTHYRWQTGTSQQPHKNRALYYRWQPQTSLTVWLKQYADRALHGILQHQIEAYLNQIEAQPLSLPTTALHYLNQIHRHTSGMMIILHDIGVKDLTGLAKTAVPQQQTTPPTRLPVNLHSIHHWLTHQQARIYTAQQQQHNMTVAVIPDQHQSAQARYPLTYQACEHYLHELNPDALSQYKPQRQTSLSEAEQLATLSIHQADPALLATYLPDLLERGVHVDNRLQWCKQLTRAWRHYVPSGQPGQPRQFMFQLSLLAIDLHHWALAQTCLQACIAWYGENTALLHNLALVLHARGDSQAASHWIQQAHAADPEDDQIQQLSKEIQTYQAYCEQQHGYQPTPARHDLLCLQPLARHHASAYYWQYRHPHIARLVRSYTLNNIEDTRRLIQHWQDEGTHDAYAILHQDNGFIGCVALEKDERQGEYATFSIWIGLDYQGQGYGQQAIKLCLDQARASGLHYVVTSTWQHNRRSHHVLQKAGFELLDYSQGQGKKKEAYYVFLLTDQPTSKQQKKRIRQILKQATHSDN